MSDTVPLVLYSWALDEIYELRRALAYEALRTQADLEYKTFPKSRREISEMAVVRMQAAARGEVFVAYAGKASVVTRRALRAAGASETLTRAEWESQLPGAAT